MKTQFTLILLFIAIALNAQNITNSYSGLVTYERLLSYSGTAPTKKDFALYFNPNYSVFVENKRNKSKNGVAVKSGKQGNVLSVNIRFDGAQYIMYTNFEKDSILSQVSLNNTSYILQEKLKNINWEIKNKYKYINDLKTQKAIGVFRGRKYIAWFTKKIPVRYGPWKFNGLPGLILHVHDTRKEIYFYVTSIKIPFHSLEYKKNFHLNKEIPRISLKQYVQYREEQADNLIKKFKSRLPEGATFKVQEIHSNRIETKFDWEEETKED